MRPQPKPRMLVAIFTAALLALLGALSVAPAARNVAAADYYPPPPGLPPNDNFAAALSLDSLPNTQTYDLQLATREDAEPHGCTVVSHSVWYRLSFQSQVTIKVMVETPAAVDLFQGESLAGLSPQGCSLDSETTFTLSAATPYYLRIARGEDISNVYTTVTIEEVRPSVNDNFADATPITSVPVELTAAIEAVTMEPGEPQLPCEPLTSDAVMGSIWFAFTAPARRAYVAEISGSAWPGLAVYTGTALSSLSRVGSTCYGGRVVLVASAGETLYLQVGEFWSKRSSVSLMISQAPDPTVFISHEVWEPSTEDTIVFDASVYDPVSQEVVAWSWSFGDGSTSTEARPAHRYTADGDYTVRLTVTTSDGRHASSERLLQIRTRDVAIVKFTVPGSARVGQSREIVVSITNNLQAEYVCVFLDKRDPSSWSGWAQVGYYVQYVPSRPANRSTSYSFNYVFTPDDGQSGQVTFRASASIVRESNCSWPLRDLDTTDNEKIATTARITR